MYKKGDKLIINKPGSHLHGKEVIFQGISYPDSYAEVILQDFGDEFRIRMDTCYLERGVMACRPVSEASPKKTTPKKDHSKFYMLYADGCGVPTRKHWNRSDAVAEAERLAEELGCDIFMLEATEFCRYEEPKPIPLERSHKWRQTIPGAK